jgi:hypothetical protein
MSGIIYLKNEKKRKRLPLYCNYCVSTAFIVIITTAADAASAANLTYII